MAAYVIVDVKVADEARYEQARAFYDSPLYRAARAKRAGATEYFNMIVVEGV